jgi:hypothetical protein
MNSDDLCSPGQESDELFLRRIKRDLNRSSDALDGYTVSRLNGMRCAVLEQKQSKRHPLLFPFGGLVTACVLVLSFSMLYQPGTVTDGINANTPIEDIEILSATESLEFYEDYEFYQWLAVNEASI